MKICPHCRTTYTDDDLQFCLQDGNVLASYTPSYDQSDAETVISPRRENIPVQDWRENEVPRIPTVAEEEPQKSGSLKIVLLTMLGMFLLFGLGGLGAWMYWRNSDREVVVDVNNNINAKPSPSKTPTPVQNTNQNTSPTPTPTPTPAPKPTLNPEQTAQAETDIDNLIQSWKSSSEILDLDTHLTKYADVVDYYKGGKVSRAKVRADKERAYNMYNSVTVNISNLKITPDPEGSKAVAVFDKEWVFENEEKVNEGKVMQELEFEKINNEWKITSEKDLKIYYVNK